MHVQRAGFGEKKVYIFRHAHPNLFTLKYRVHFKQIGVKK